MPRNVSRVCLLPSLAVCLTGLTGCGGEEAYPSRPVLLVCPWAVGGGTDRVSRQMAAYLEHELGVPVNVINAIGGAGVTGHSRGARARPDGYTLTMMTVEINMLRWRKLTTISWEDFEPVMLINRDSTALFVRKDAPWKDLAELTEAVRSDPGTLTASGTATGGIWHLGLAGWLTSIGLDADAITWVPMNGAGPSLKELASGGLDLVSCSLPEARTLAGEVRCLGVMADERVAGFEDVPTFKEQGVEWSLGAWRGLGVPKGTPPEIVEKLVGAIDRIVTGKTELAGRRFPEFMAAEGFDASVMHPDEFRPFLAQTDRALGDLLTSDAFAGLNQPQFPPMAFPRLLFTAMAALLVLLLIQRIIKGPESPADREGEAPAEPRVTALEKPASTFATSRGIVHFVEVVLAVALYVLLAERLGFILTAAPLVLLLLWRLGTRLTSSLAVTVVLVPAVYQLFANLLRVPLPRGFLGW
jgi:tripartite-type tricarboxylate transporter receptor subunit TctC